MKENPNVIVSVIVPVYNVENYLDKCIKSIRNQTFKKFEIIIIDDGSTDGCGRKCREWEKKDHRIRAYTKENEGLGPTRSLGVSLAVGKYLFFVDSDDWIDARALELMVENAETYGSDIVVCNRFLVRNENGSLVKVPYKHSVSIQGWTNAYKNPEIIDRMDTATWDKLYRRDFWAESGMVQPAHPYEDTAVIPILLMLAERVSQVTECLYYYYIDRPDNITGQVGNLKYIEDSLCELFAHAKERKLFERWKDRICRYAVQMLKGISFHLRNNDFEVKERLQAEYCGQIEHLLDRQFHDWDRFLRFHYTVWGSYNLRCCVAKIILTASQMNHHFGFSSILSIENYLDVSMVKGSSFRNDMLRKDLNKEEFVACMKEEHTENDYFVFDFLEERFDVAKKEDQYITISDAFIDSGFTAENIIPRKEIEWKLWQEKFDKFIEVVESAYKRNHILLVRMRLAEGYGEYSLEHYFENVERIRDYNDYITRCEEYVSTAYPEIKILSLMNRRELFYTDIKYIHGCRPEHLNDLFYYAAADQMIDYFDKKEAL